MSRPQYAGKSIVEKLWDEAIGWYQNCIDLQQNGLDANRELGICRGLAIAIFHMSRPQFADEDDVAREIVRRHDTGDTT